MGWFFYPSCTLLIPMKELQYQIPNHGFWIASIVAFICLCQLVWKLHRKSVNQQFYLIDYECFKPADDDRKLSSEMCGQIAFRNQNLGATDYQFLLKILVASGLGEETYAPIDIINDQKIGLRSAVDEMEEPFFNVLDRLFQKTGINPRSLDVLVVNVSMLSTEPSLACRIIHRYKMEDVKVINLAGMGCSGSLTSLCLIKDMFKVHNNLMGLVVTSECIGPSWYTGLTKSMMVTNCLFRSGCCAMIMTNNQNYRARSKFRLKALFRVITGGLDDDAYESVMEKEDELGLHGFHLGKYLIKAASKAISINLTQMAPLILPYRELARYVVLKFLVNRKNDAGSSDKAGVDFKSAIDHFCIHPGGSGVINGVGKSLGLSEYDLEPARMALYRFGNTSASGIWYEMAYMEAKKRLKKGNMVLQIGLGSGFKCNTACWEVLRDLDDKGVWEDCINSYPPKSTVNGFMEKYGWLKDLKNIPAEYASRFK